MKLDLNASCAGGVAFGLGERLPPPPPLLLLAGSLLAFGRLTMARQQHLRQMAATLRGDLECALETDAECESSLFEQQTAATASSSIIIIIIITIIIGFVCESRARSHSPLGQLAGRLLPSILSSLQ